MTTPTIGNQTQTEFEAAYDGPALSQHTMEIRDLAPALLALGQAFDRANGLLNGNRAAVSLEIKATQPGSFEIALLLKQLYEQGVGAFSGDFVSSALNLKELFFGGTAVGSIGLIALIKRLRGKRITEVVQQGQNISIQVDTTTRLTISKELLDLHNDGILRDQLAAIVRPLAREGITDLVFSEQKRQLESINKEEAHFFRAADTDFTDINTVMLPRQRLRPVSPSFRRKGKWKLTDGEKARWYTMNDQAFLKEVDEGTRLFGAKDVLICQVIMRQSVSDTGELKMEHEITAVLDHMNAPTQAKLLADDGVNFHQPTSS